MYAELPVVIISALLSTLAGGVASTEIIRKLLYRILKKELPKKSYWERLSDLTSNLTKASGEVDAVLQEMTRVSKDRETSIRVLEAGLVDLEKREKELKEKIALLQSVPIPVAEQFARLVEPAERRSARRDYMLFLSGVVVTTIIAVILQFFSFGKSTVEPTDAQPSRPAPLVERP